MTVTLNQQYAISDSSQQKYPALQADDYQPKLKQQINICLSEQSVDILSPETILALDFDIKTCIFGDDEATVFIPKADVQYIPLGMPKLFLYDKNTERYEFLTAGTKLAGTGKVTAAKLFVCAIVNQQILLNNDGSPQVFTLNLKSSKTAIIKAKSPKPGDGTLYSLNGSLVKRHKIRGWLGHLVSIAITAVPEKYISSVSGESSIGIKFCLGDSDTPLSDENQKLMFDLLQNTELQADMKNPFKIGSVETIAQTTYCEPDYSEDIIF